MVGGAHCHVRTDVPRQLAAGRLPDVAEVVGVRAAVELAVELRVDERAAVPGVRRRAAAAVEDPAATEDVAAGCRPGRGVVPVALRQPDGECRGCRKREGGVEQEDGARQRDGEGGGTLPTGRQHHAGK